MTEARAFFSYSRHDGEFALKLARDLRNAGAAIWIDQLDIPPGDHWDTAVQKAVESSSSLVVVLSPNSVASQNVMDEVAYAIEENKLVIPVVGRTCDIPFRLRRVQYIDVQTEYEDGVQRILTQLRSKQQNASGPPVQSPQATTAQWKVAQARVAADSSKKWMIWAVGGAVLFLALLVALLSSMSHKGRDTQHPPSNPSAADSRPDLHQWLQELLSAEQGPSIEPLRNFFDETVSPYSSFSSAGWSEIAKDKQAYFRRFPQIQYKLLSWKHTSQPDGSEEIECDAQYREVRNDGVVAQGVTQYHMTVRLRDGQWKITAIH